MTSRLTDDGVYQSMARTARRDELAFVGLDGADGPDTAAVRS